MPWWGTESGARGTPGAGCMGRPGDRNKEEQAPWKSGEVAQERQEVRPRAGAPIPAPPPTPSESHGGPGALGPASYLAAAGADSAPYWEG